MVSPATIPQQPALTAMLQAVQTPAQTAPAPHAPLIAQATKKQTPAKESPAMIQQQPVLTALWSAVQTPAQTVPALHAHLTALGIKQTPVKESHATTQ